MRVGPEQLGYIAQQSMLSATVRIDVELCNAVVSIVEGRNLMEKEAPFAAAFAKTQTLQAVCEVRKKNHRYRDGALQPLFPQALEDAARRP